jgi:aspartate/tyrosine/aromatic aminotransferase
MEIGTMLERLERLPTDPILGLMALFRADSDPRKVDLGVGVFRDDRGETPVLSSVRRAEQVVLGRQATKAYVAAGGNAGFNDAMANLVLGQGHPALAADRVRSIQAPGGCGALRLGAELFRIAQPETVVHVSTPTWANHVPLLTGCGLKLEKYPYYDPATGGVKFEEMLGTLDRLPVRSVVLLHASCHNPTGADLSEAQWQQLLPVFKRRSLVPFIDLAYQGLGRGVAEDAFGIRLFAAELPEVAIAVSCSKNFGLYRERTGCLHMVNQTPAAGDAALSQLIRIARSIYSMPPDHGAAIVLEILGDSKLREEWSDEVGAMRKRITGLRHELVKQLARHYPQRNFSFIGAQHGMFSFLGVTTPQVQALRNQHHIYMMDDSRMNIAGLRADNLEYFAAAVAQVLRQ